MADRELQGRIAWVTGGASGMGRATALELARMGADVAIGSLVESQRGAVLDGQTCFTPGDGQLQSVAREIEAHGVRALALPLDVCDPASIRSSHARITRELGPIDILVNAAGSTVRKRLADHPDALWQRMLDLNVTSAYRTIQLCFPGMVERRWGRIVNFASTAASTGYQLHAAYCASKSALLGLTRTVGLEGAPHGVTCNAVSPGFVATDQNYMGSGIEARLLGHQMDADAYRAHVASQLPQKRYLTPAEVGALAAFLCREETGGIDAANITIAMGSSW